MNHLVHSSLLSRMIDRANEWSPVVVALSVFLLLRPYDGIVHDARLYMGYVLAAWDPQSIGQDLMFVHDGQSGYSVFPSLLNVVGRAVGLVRGAMVLSVAALLLWFTAAWRLVWAMFPTLGTTVRAALLLWGTSLHTLYGGASTFHFAEMFATPRPLAEALVLLTLATLVQHEARATNRGAADRLRVGSALLLVLLAAVVHPLMIAPGLVAMVWLVPPPTWRVPLTGVGAALVLFVLALTHWTSADQHTGWLLATFDAEWLEVLVRRGSIALLSQWQHVDWVRVAVQLTSVLVARHLVSGRVRILWDAMVMAGVGGVLISWLATDVVHHRLITQVQPWRVLWVVGLVGSIAVLVQLRAVVGSPDEAQSLSGSSRRRQLERLATGFLLLAWFMLEVSAAAGWLLLGSIMLFGLARSRLSLSMAERPLRVAFASVIVAIVVLTALRAFVVWEVYAVHPDASTRWVWRTWVTSGLPNAIVLGGALVLTVAQLRSVTGDRRRRLLMPAFATVLAILSFAVLDQRTDYATWLDAMAERQAASSRGGGRTPDSGAAFWLDADMEPWILLNRPAWGGVLQGTPKIFDRRLAMVWEDRAVLADRITHPDWARRSDLALRSVNAAMVQTICHWPSGPAVIVAPLDSIDAEIPRDTIRAGAPRYLPPDVRKGPWLVVSAYGVIRCAGPTNNVPES